VDARQNENLQTQGSFSKLVLAKAQMLKQEGKVPQAQNKSNSGKLSKQKAPMRKNDEALPQINEIKTKSSMGNASRDKKGDKSKSKKASRQARN